MSPKPPHPIELDEMVLGTEAPDGDDWQRLVGAPGGASAWAAAVKRRERLNRRAALVRGRPWLAALWLEGRQALRAAASTGGTWTLDVGPPRLAAALAPSETRELQLPWGGSDLVAVPVGQVVRVRPHTGVQVFFRTQSADGELTTPWRVEEGEGPVVFVAVQAGATSVKTIEDAVGRRLPIAILTITPDSGKAETD